MAAPLSTSACLSVVAIEIHRLKIRREVQRERSLLLVVVVVVFMAWWVKKNSRGSSLRRRTTGPKLRSIQIVTHLAACVRLINKLKFLLKKWKTKTKNNRLGLDPSILIILLA